MSETSQPNAAENNTRPQIPRTKIWIIAGLFLVAAIGMYAGTMYRIQNYGYVGLGADQPIKPGAELTN